MQIQLWERIGVSRGEAASWSTAPHAARQETGKRRAGIGRSDVEEAAHKNLFRSEAEGCKAPRPARESWMERTEFMRPAASREESEIRFRQP